MRNTYQAGAVVLVNRKSGACWRYRWRDAQGIHRSEHVGTLLALPTKADAQKAAERFRRHINAKVSGECITVTNLIDKFWKECPPERESTAHGYRAIFKRIEARFGGLRIDSFASDMQTVETWLKELAIIGRHPKKRVKPRLVSNLYRGQVRNLMHLLLEKAMLWCALHMDRNPIETIRLKNTSERQKDIVTLTPEQFQALMDDKELPFMVKTIFLLDAALGLRISEILGLKWAEVDLDASTVRVKHSVVNGEVYDTKTKTSKRKLPLHPYLVAMLRQWKAAEPVVNGWLFGSERTGMPFTRDWLRAQYLKPAGERVGASGLGFHSGRHSFRNWLRQTGADLEDQKNLLGHSRLTTTMIYGGDDQVERLREPNSKVVEMLVRRSA